MDPLVPRGKVNTAWAGSSTGTQSVLVLAVPSVILA